MKKAAFLGLTVLLLCFLSAALAQQVTVDGLIYDIQNGVAEVVGVDANATTVVFHAQIEGNRVHVDEAALLEKLNYAMAGWITKLVVSAEIESFEGGYGWVFNPVTELEIQEGVKHIGKNTFSGVPVKELRLPEGLLSIGENAFMYCSSIEKITIPASLERLDEGALYGLSGLKEIDLAEGNAYFQLIDGILYTKGDAQRLLLMPNDGRESLQVDENTKSIADGAFSGNETVKELIVNEGITALEPYVFQDLVALKTAYLPKSLTTMERFGSFAVWSAIENIFVAEGNPDFESRDGALYYKNQLWFFPFAGRVAYDLPFYGETEVPAFLQGNMVLESLSLARGYESIPPNCFEYSVALKRIALPMGLKSIGEWAFSGCLYLEEMMIPPTVTSIGDYVFYDCPELKRVVIPSSVEHIGQGAFGYAPQVIIVGEYGSAAYDYAFANDLPFTTGSEEPKTPREMRVKFEACVVAAASVNEETPMYDRASSKGKKLGSFKNGTTAIIKEKGNAFTLLQIGDKEGYIANDKLAFTHDLTHVRVPILGRESERIRGQGFDAYTQPYDGAAKITVTNDPDILILDTVGVFYEIMLESEIRYVLVNQLDAAMNRGEGEWEIKMAVVSNPNFRDRLHLRDRPSTKGKSLGRYFSGTQVQVLAYEGEWCHVLVDGKEGYMLAEYLTALYPHDSKEALRGNG